MKQFTHSFSLIPASNIESQFKNDIAIINPDKVAKFISLSPVSVDAPAERSSLGITYAFEFRAIVNDSRILEFNKKKAVLCLNMSDGSQNIVGDKSDPPLIAITTVGSNYVIETQYRLIEPLI